MAKLVAVDDVPKGAKLVLVEDQGKPVGEQMNDWLGDVSLGNLWRQVGLTARAGVQGVGDILDLAASPVRVGLNSLGANIQGRTGEALANLAGLPKAELRNEKIAERGAEFMAAGAVPIVSAMRALSPAASVAPSVTENVLRSLSTAPKTQLVSAASAGGAGEYVKQTGGDEGSQFVASLAGGLAPSAVVGAANAAQNLYRNLIAKPTSQNIDIAIQQIIDNGDYGIQFANVAGNVRSQLRNDVKDILKAGGKLDEDAMRRLVDYRLVGATPTRGSITLDPVQITKERNLAKLGANTNDETLQSLARIQNTNNQRLIAGLNDLGANTSDDSIAAANAVMQRLQALNANAKGTIDNAYAAARATSGRSAAIDPAAFTQRANNLLDDALLGGKLPSDVRNLLNRTAAGEIPLTVDVAEQFKTRIGDLQRATTDMAERKALGLVRQALDDAPLLEGQGQSAIDAFNNARSLNRKWMTIVDKVPALQAVRDGIEPDKFVQQFIIGNGTKASVMDVAKLKRLIKDSPEAMNAVKGQILSVLKSKALNGATDEVGNFSQSAFNKAFRDIGERKMRLFFTPEELTQLKAIGRVASYEQFQPRGSAVNNSNSGAMALGNVMDWMANSNVLSRIPGATELIRNPARNFSTQIKLNEAQNITPGLLQVEPKQAWTPPLWLLMAPVGMQQ